MKPAKRPSDKAIELMLYIAYHGEKTGKLQSMTVVQKYVDFSRSSCEQIMVELKKANLVVGRRGNDGGYSISRPAEEITALDIKLALDPEPQSSDLLDGFLQRMHDFERSVTLRMLMDEYEQYEGNQV